MAVVVVVLDCVVSTACTVVNIDEIGCVGGVVVVMMVKMLHGTSLLYGQAKVGHNLLLVQVCVDFLLFCCYTINIYIYIYMNININVPVIVNFN